MAVLMQTCLVPLYLVLCFKMGGGASVSISFLTGMSMVGVFCCCCLTAGVTCCCFFSCSTLRGDEFCWVVACCCIAVSFCMSNSFSVTFFMVSAFVWKMLLSCFIALSSVSCNGGNGDPKVEFYKALVSSCAAAMIVSVLLLVGILKLLCGSHATVSVIFSAFVFLTHNL